MKKNTLRITLPALGAALVVAALAMAGPIEPPAPPPPDPDGPTMKSLNEIPASWHQTLPADDDGDLFDLGLPCDSQRFRCALPVTDAGVAVLDLETGLVWEREPEETVMRWDSAHETCYGRELGGRFGWRLPRVHELATLLDLSETTHLPDGHPFELNVEGPGLNLNFWTETEKIDDVDMAYSIHFADTDGPDQSDKTLLMRVWCVRAAN